MNENLSLLQKKKKFLSSTGAHPPKRRLRVLIHPDREGGRPRTVGEGAERRAKCDPEL